MGKLVVDDDKQERDFLRCDRREEGGSASGKSSWMVLSRPLPLSR